MAKSNSKDKSVKRTTTDSDDAKMINWIDQQKDSARESKLTRMQLNRQNFDMYHMRQNWDHKNPGQSREFLNKQSMATEQISSFFQQAIVDQNEWFRVDSLDPRKADLMAIKPSEIQRLLLSQLDTIDFYTTVGNSVKTALLGSLAIFKVHGGMVKKPKFRTKKEGKGKTLKRTVVKVEDKTWQLKIDLVRQENFYPDPTGEGLYNIEEQWMDLHKVIALSEGEDAIYNKAQVAKLSRRMDTDIREQHEKSRETNQNPTNGSLRRRVKITEYWGDVIDDDGKLLHENIVMTMANDKFMIRRPTENPNWHQLDPYVVVPLLEVPHSVWHKALMDAPTMHNHALNEMYNLIVDGAMMAVHGISQIRIDNLEDIAQVDNGIKPGVALKVNSSLPVGAKVAEPVITADIPTDALNVLDIIKQEFNASALTNDFRAGATSSANTKATAIVESSQSITSTFTGIAKNFEEKGLQKVLAKSWMTMAQFMTDIDDEHVKALLGTERHAAIEALSPQDRFVETVSGIKFRVFGISRKINLSQDFRKYTTLLQTVGANDIFLEEYTKRWDLGLLLEDVMRSLDISTWKLELPEAVQETMQAGAEQEAQQQVAPGAAPDELSQVPQAANATLEESFGGGFAQANFPGSRALSGG